MPDGEELLIVTAGPVGSRRRSLFLGEALILTTSRDVVRALELEDGSPVDVDRIRELIRAEEPAWIKQRALQLLGYRERSHAELARRLGDDGYDPAEVEDVLLRLEELGLLDDGRFTAAYVRTKLAAGWGRRKIADGLRTAGLAPETIEASLPVEYPEDERDRAASLVDSRRIRTREEAVRAVNRLVRRGFSYAVARDVAFRALESDADEGPHDHSS